MRTKTPGEASRVAARARRRVAQLMRSKKNSEYDEAEIEAALLHAEQMERVAQKRIRNLEVEEQAERGIKRTEIEEMLEGEEEAQGTEDVSGAESGEEASAEDETLNGMSEEDLEKAMRELEQALDEMEKISESAEDFAETMDEMSEALSGDMEPSDLGEMNKHRQKHRRHYRTSPLPCRWRWERRLRQLLLHPEEETAVPVHLLLRHPLPPPLCRAAR